MSTKPSFADVIAQLEKVNVSQSVWKVGVWKSGMWEHGVFDEVLANLEK